MRTQFEQAAQTFVRAESGRQRHPLLPAGMVTALQDLMTDLNARGAGVETAELRLLRPGERPLSYTLPAQAPDTNKGRGG